MYDWLSLMFVSLHLLPYMRQGLSAFHHFVRQAGWPANFSGFCVSFHLTIGKLKLKIGNIYTQLYMCYTLVNHACMASPLPTDPPPHPLEILPFQCVKCFLILFKAINSLICVNCLLWEFLGTYVSFQSLPLKVTNSITHVLTSFHLYINVSIGPICRHEMAGSKVNLCYFEDKFCAVTVIVTV